ncbi:MAG: radical SAM protein [Candidatus Omnitrophota bacterium]
MNILLIFPPSTIYGKDPTVPSVVLPLGLAYIAANLEQHHYKVSILDARSLSEDRVIISSDKALYGFTDEELRLAIEKHAPDIIGISCMYTSYSGDAHRVAKIAKEINPAIVVVMGGAHASVFHHLALKDNNVDIIVRGEGEETFLELVKYIENKLEYTEIRGISFRNKQGLIVMNPARPPIANLDTIPFPARHLLGMNLYLNNKPGSYAMRAPHATMITSRGCLGECIYCTIQSVWGKRKWRGRSAQNVVDEMEMLHKGYGIKEIYLMDDSAGTSKQRLAEICKEILRRNLDIRWTTPNGIAHWLLDEDTLRLMKMAGCYRITFGIESGNVQTRAFLGKPFSLEQAKRLIGFANKIGMWTACTFIIGFPFETQEAIRDTVSFACNSGVDMAVFYLLCPHPGTKVYEIFKEEGLLNLDRIMDPTATFSNKDFEEMGMKLAGRGVRTRYFTPEELQKNLSLAYRSFFKASFKHFLSPLKIARKIRNTEDLMYTIKIGKIGTRMVFVNIFEKAFMSQDIIRRSKNVSELKEL